MEFHVRQKPGANPYLGLMAVGNKIIPCALGRSGITTQKREGDGATPAGSFSLLYGYYRADRVNRPDSMLEFQRITSKMGWCDEPSHPAYNSEVGLPFSASHEVMTREDRLYDICIVLDYNISTRARGKGSAIFFHQAKDGFQPTEGCVALLPNDMRRLLPMLTRDTAMIIHP